MSGMADMTDTQSMEDRIRALEAQNARLVAASAPSARARGGRWRTFASAVCIIVAAILVPVSIVGAWARVQLVEEDAFVATLAPLVEDASVQAMVIEESMEAISANVDFEQVTADVFDGIAALGLPPRAASALQLLQAPAANGLESLVTTTVTRVVESDAFAEVWNTATRGAHRALTAASTSDGGGLVVRTADGVGIQLGAIVERVKANLLERGLGAAQLIPTVDRVVIIGEGNNLAAIRTGYALASTLGWWLPVITLALFGLGILLARRRSTAVLGTGLGLAIGGASLAATLSIGSAAMGVVAGDLELSPSGLEVIYAQLVGAMTQTAVVVALLGAFVALLGWTMGASAPAQAVRRTIRGINASARRRLAARGLDTGAFGSWLARQRVLVRTIVAVLAVLWLFALRPLALGDVVLVVVVALGVAWLLELLQRRPDEQPDTTAGAEAAAGAAEVPADIEESSSPDAATAVAAASGAEDRPSV